MSALALNTSHSQFFSSKLLSSLCNYLNPKDLFSLSVTSKSMYFMVDEYLSYLLKRKKLIIETNEQILDKNGDNLGLKSQKKYNLIFKHFFYQELKITVLNNGKEFDPSNNLNLNNIFSKGIKEFNIGHKFSAFLTYENVLFYAKTQEFLESKDNVLLEKRRVKAFTAHRNIIYLTEFGQVFIIFYQKNRKTHECQEDLILWTLSSPIENLFTSYNFIILQSLSSSEQSIKLYVFDLLDFQLSKINEEKRLREISLEKCPEFQGMISCAVGSNVAYFISLENGLYVCDLKNILMDRTTKERIELQPFGFFSNKQITNISSSFLSYFAIEKEKIPSIENWDNASVLKWAEVIGFVDCLKLLKFYKITGKDLLNIERRFLSETLGIQSEEIQNRFLREIEKKKVITYKPLILYAWGSNAFGQLGCTNGNLPAPLKISLPSLGPDDDIEKIEIGWKITAILTKKKKLWISEALNKSKQPLLIENHHENNSNEKIVKRKDSEKLRNKEEKKFLVYNSSSNCKSHRWIDVTNFYAKFHKVNKLFKYV